MQSAFWAGFELGNFKLGYNPDLFSQLASV